jgi:hypothetical protein
MNIDDVMQQIADQADTIVGLQCFPYPPDKIVPPTFEVGLPAPINFDEEYDEGSDGLVFPAAVWVGRKQDRSSVANIAPYVATSGAQSIKAVLESGTYTAFETLHIPTVEFVIAPIAGIEYLGAQYTIEITGPGG